MALDIRTVDVADDTAYRSWFAAHDEALRHDFPDGPHWREQEARIQVEPSAVIDTVLLAAEDDDGEVAGTVAMELPLKDNLTTAQIEVGVRPIRRRRGIGSALLEAAESEAVRRGRSRFMADIEGPLGPQESSGTHFAERHGYTRRIVEIMRVLRPPFDHTRLDELEQRAAQHADDYRIVSWRDRTPDEYVDEFARMTARMSTDAPLGSLDYEEEFWDAARVRIREERISRMRRGVWCTVAVAADGTIAGQTELQLSTDDDSTAFQEETIVDPRHRGHRLGLLMKVVNLRQLLRDRPGVGTIWTWNADTNAYMVAVNDQLGFVVAGWLAGYQRDR